MNFSAALSQLCFLASSLARCRLHPSSSSLRYTSFFSASLVGYYLRTRHGFRCLPIAVERCYGPTGLICLNIALLFRLWNEIWSNVAVVASFYSSETRTVEWWIAAILSAAVRLASPRERAPPPIITNNESPSFSHHRPSPPSQLTPPPPPPRLRCPPNGRHRRCPS